jgi:hypothetical protein
MRRSARDWPSTAQAVVARPSLRVVPARNAAVDDSSSPQAVAEERRERARAAAASQLQSAWNGLGYWEDMAEDELGAALGELVMLLWSIHRFGHGPFGRMMVDAVIAEVAGPAGEDPVLDDILTMTFALGAAWAEDRRRQMGTDSPAPQPPAPTNLNPTGTRGA